MSTCSKIVSVHASLKYAQLKTADNNPFLSLAFFRSRPLWTDPIWRWLEMHVCERLNVCRVYLVVTGIRTHKTTACPQKISSHISGTLHPLTKEND